MDEINQTPHCPDCGRPMAKQGWSLEQCPHCLLELALQESSGEELTLDDGGTAVTQDLPALQNPV